MKLIIFKLQSLQNSCIEIIEKGRGSQRKTTGILPVNKLVDFELCKIWHKNSLGLLPINLSNNMNTDQNNKGLEKIHGYNTRRKNLQNRPRSTMHQYHDSFLVKGNRLYSHLDQQLQSIKSIRQFCSTLKKKMLEY